MEGVKEVTNDAQALATKIIESCKLLLTEIEKFEDRAKNVTRAKRDPSFLTYFKSQVETEIQRIEQLGRVDSTFQHSINRLHSSNYTNDLAVWTVAKTCTGVRSIKKLCHVPIGLENKWGDKSFRPADIIAKNGAEWVKVSTVDEKRIMWDITKNGYGNQSEVESDHDDNGAEIAKAFDLTFTKPLLRMIEASRWRVSFRCPEIRFVLPRLSEKATPQYIQDLLNDIRKQGVTVETKDELPLGATAFDEKTIAQMASFDTFTDTLNLDITVIIMLCSDISHGTINSTLLEQVQFPGRETSRQMDAETNENVLPAIIWPAMVQHRLVCSRTTYNRITELINTLGSAIEKRRLNLLFEVGIAQQQRLQELQSLSARNIPANWCLPIQVLDDADQKILEELPDHIFDKVSNDLKGHKEVSTSSLYLSWVSELTLLSCHKVAFNALQTSIEKHRGNNYKVVGPDVCIVPRAVSLGGLSDW